jgi:hypothetical protein
MKQILLALVTFALVLVPQAEAVHPHLDSLRIEITNQQAIVSNTVPIDKKLATTLRVSLSKMFNAGPSDPVKAASALASVASKLGKSSLSNVFGPVLETANDNFLGSLTEGAEGLSDRLAAVFPSRTRTSAEKKLNQVWQQIASGQAEANVVAAAKLIGKALKAIAVTEKLVAKAEDAPLPPAQFTATITGAVLGNFNFTPAPAEALANENGDLLAILAVNVKLSGSGLNTITTRTLQLFMPIADGTHVYDIADLGTNVVVLVYRVAQRSNGSPTASEAYHGATGTVTVTMNTAARTAIGTFSFVGPAEGDSGTTASSADGTFSVVWED